VAPFQRQGGTAQRGSLMLHFHYTCALHQRMFIDAVKRGGCHDPAKMDEVRRKTLAWLSIRFPRMVLDHFNESSCLGCKLEWSGVGLEELGRVITGLAMGAAAAEEVQR
jgi:hypothetical protein